MEPSLTTPKVVRFGVFEADLRSGELRRQGIRVKLQEKPFQLLATLLERPGDVVTREELREKLWPGDTFVDFDHGINIAINKLREALGDSAESPRLIETLARRGYRFMGEVEPVISSIPPPPAVTRTSEDAPAQGPAADSQATPLPSGVESLPPAGAAFARYSRAKTIALLLFAIAVAGYLGWRLHTPRVKPSSGRVMLAVLPFENLSGNTEQDYFSDGLTEEMITQLGGLHPERLGVIARTTMMQYRGTHKTANQIGRELGADYILEGSVRRSDGRVRIAAQLIQVSDQTHVWADSYERNLSNVLELQSDVAGAIAERIQLQLTPAQRQRLASAPAVNPAAYEDYLKGRFYWNERTGEGFQKAIAQFDQAIAKDANYAPPYAGLADTYNLLGSVPANVLEPRVAMSKAREAAAKALALDESLAEAHVSLGYVKMAYEWDFPAAEAEFERAIELNPAYPTAHQWYAFYLTAMGRADDADRENMLAKKLDPLSLSVNSQIAWSYYIARRYGDAVTQSQKLIDLEPNLYTSHLYLGLAYEGQKLYPQAIAEFQKANALSGGNPIILGALGHTYAVSGNRAKANELIAQLESIAKKRYVPGLYPAAIYSGLDDKAAAIRWLTKAVEDRSDYCLFLPLEPEAENLRSDPRFKELVRRIGLPQSSN
ncbi:MAG TPA: winged helix-turn-helix domain-containing protein [Terriglobia bacterium]|nr:winged helix-turn-helix domain-containing protein [Terriglobia bacterium]